MTGRETRQQLIKQLIRGNEISSQDELLSLMAGAGVSTTQATLSRDLKVLCVARKSGRYELDDSAEYATALANVVGMEILGVAHNGHMIVVRTLIGRAQGVAAYLDGMAEPLILGTVAGDDTVFIAPSRVDFIESLVLKIESLIR
jgi:transcriptional regulator of arginine metabolism